MTWSRTCAVALLVVALTLGVAGVLRVVERRAPVGRSPAAAAPTGLGGAAATVDTPEDHTGLSALGVLHAWDRRRALAWSRGDVAMLRALYTPSSVAGARDRSLLRRWIARDVLVRGWDVQVLGAEVLHRGPGRIVLEVTDRLSGLVAVGAGTRTPLPTDRASTWRVTLRRVEGDWRVASVRGFSPSRVPSAGSR